MAETITFEVFGIPTPQGSKNVYRGRLVEAQSAKLKIWRQEVKDQATLIYSGELLEGPLRLDVIFFMPRPKTVKRDKPTVPPDTDKLIRGVGDALTGTIFRDDSQLVEIYAEKRYADERMPGAELKITVL